MFSAKTKKVTHLDTIKLMKRIKASQIKVGLPKSTSAKMHKDSDLSIAAIGAIHEFGSSDGKIPERSFIRTTIQAKRKDIKKLFHTETKKVIAGTQSVDKMMGKIGVLTSGAIQKTIVDLTDPANAPSTVSAKGSSNPLIDSGQMRQSVTWELVDAT